MKCRYSIGSHTFSACRIELARIVLERMKSKRLPPTNRGEDLALFSARSSTVHHPQLVFNFFPASFDFIYLLSSTVSTRKYITMLQRTLFRASRQAPRHISRSQTFCAPVQQQLRSTRAVPASALRWYSEQPAAKEGEASESKSAEPSSSSQSNEATQLKEQIEKKDKEIIDLKVQQPHLPAYSSYLNIITNTLLLGQISPLRSGLPQPSRPHSTGSQSCQRLRPPTVRPRPRRIRGQLGPRAHHCAIRKTGRRKQ